MRYFFKPLSVFGLLAAVSPAWAGWSANAGYLSDYLFRGIPQAESSAYTGLDFEAGGFYAGTWLADVDDDIEYDLYGGYGWAFDNGLSLSVGATGYFYSDEFDETYREANFNAAWSIVSLEYSAGRYDSPLIVNTVTVDDEQDYSFGAVTVGDSIYFTYGTFGRDFDGDYVEVGYGKSVGELDVNVALVAPDEDLVGPAAEDVYLTLDLGFAFDL